MTSYRRALAARIGCGLAWALPLLGGRALAQPAIELPAVPVAGERPKGPEPLPEPLGPPPTPLLPTPLEISGRTVPVANAIGGPYSASQGFFTQADIQNQPLFRTTEFLEQIPGLVLANETNGIDAATMFLRGFNIDHGTDFAFFIDGVPINLVIEQGTWLRAVVRGWLTYHAIPGNMAALETFRTELVRYWLRACGAVANATGW